LQVCKLHRVPPFFQHPCVLLFLSMLSCSSILLQVFKLHHASLVVLPPMIPHPTIVPPTSYNSISYKCNSLYHQHCNLLLSLLFFFAFFWFCSLIAIFFYLSLFFFPLPFLWFCSLIVLLSNLVLLFSIFVTALQAPSYTIFLSTYSCVQVHQQYV
jgi:hypothetical protein